MNDDQIPLISWVIAVLWLLIVLAIFIIMAR